MACSTCLHLDTPVDLDLDMQPREGNGLEDSSKEGPLPAAKHVSARPNQAHCQASIISSNELASSTFVGVDRDFVPVRILIVDDHPIYVEALRGLLQHVPWVDVVGEATDARQACELMPRFQPELVLLDVWLPDENGVALIPRLLMEAPGTKVLLLSADGDTNSVRHALQLGARGYILKVCTPTQLLGAIRQVLNGSVYVSPELAKDLLNGYLHALAERPQSQSRRLSNRETQVLGLIAGGASTMKIAELLSLSPKTVASHRSHIKEKLGLCGVAELTKYALREGLVQG